mmetsp:Transcript_88565/g.247716  ORF Transcript_88565/g.247716 Transcript_88565/m.247716 type:complete len:205 (+) Transcript_88565:570-1184(+)
MKAYPKPCMLPKLIGRYIKSKLSAKPSRMRRSTSIPRVYSKGMLRNMTVVNSGADVDDAVGLSPMHEAPPAKAPRPHPSEPLPSPSGSSLAATGPQRGDRCDAVAGGGRAAARPPGVSAAAAARGACPSPGDVAGNIVEEAPHTPRNPGGGRTASDKGSKQGAPRPCAGDEMSQASKAWPQSGNARCSSNALPHRPPDSALGNP